MPTEILRIFEPVPPGWLIDATVGGGGHARLLLHARLDLRLLGLDRDPDAITAAAAALADVSDRVVLRHSRFDHLRTIMNEHRIDNVSGVLFDLGVSSPQLDRGERGFSYRNDGPLDTRMDPTEPWTAADVVNGYGEAELARVTARLRRRALARRESPAPSSPPGPSRPPPSSPPSCATPYRRRRAVGAGILPGARSKLFASRSIVS